MLPFWIDFPASPFVVLAGIVLFVMQTLGGMR